jgi:transposase
MWHERVAGGSASKVFLIRRGWCLSTRPRSAPTWCVCGDGPPGGIRVIGSVPLGAWQTITFVAALRRSKMIAPMVVEGAMNREMFLAYVENCLVPTLRRNDIVVIDNCRIHLGLGIREAIEKSGAAVRFLPKYSPDLNPIEMAYSKFKTFLRKVAAHTVPGLTRAIRSFIPQLGRQECTNYFRHTGYGSI